MFLIEVLRDQKVKLFTFHYLTIHLYSLDLSIAYMRVFRPDTVLHA